jgi:hypothetical protein
MMLLAQAQSFWGDDAVSRFFARYWIWLLLFVIVAIIGARQARKR